MDTPFEICSSKIFKLATNPSVERFMALLNVIRDSYLYLTAGKLFLVLYKI